MKGVIEVWRLVADDKELPETSANSVDSLRPLINTLLGNGKYGVV